ncbi:MAG: hypothetical protein M1823_001653 [Watsoniomyces obsoletus]|nr:MAG: hypothetical protein M1823_001653 [Watsoniomyces obsoletus]
MASPNGQSQAPPGPPVTRSIHDPSYHHQYASGADASNTTQPSGAYTSNVDQYGAATSGSEPAGQTSTPSVPGIQPSNQGENTARAAHEPAMQNNSDSSANGLNGHHDGTGAIQVLCGPLLNYRHMTNAQSDTPVWHGSVLIVAKPGDIAPELRFHPLTSVGDQTSSSTNGHLGLGNGSQDASMGNQESGKSSTSTGFKLYSDPHKTFWRMNLEVPLQDAETRWEYTISNLNSTALTQRNNVVVRTFVVPSRHNSMRVMFHSCNGFSVGTDVDAWSGPALWNDVLRVHAERPFHVMIGGGDQIYNDNVRVEGPLRPWTEIHNPVKRREYPFHEDLRARCDEFYYNNYVRWYSTEPFATANAQIAQINIWDDHDIIDGFGSYTDRFMRCDVFRGLGGVAEKYYLLFQHHLPPPASTFTTDAPATNIEAGKQGVAPDPVQLKDTYVMRDLPAEAEPSYIIGSRPGPYVPEPSRNMFTQLGKGMAFLGIDARMERTRHQVNYDATYDLVFRRVDTELAKAGGQIQHLLVLLGVPIAYPRLIWLENILRSPLIGPIRFLNKRFGLAGGFFNSFDGSVDLLDDLDDHYTAHNHKKERRVLINRLQTISQRHSVRITILSGDVHLAALGRFYSHPKLHIPVEKDHRYIVNVVSSAITNKPPPAPVANMLARRNKIHHLDDDTDETLLDMFNRGPGNQTKAATYNHCTMPSRNYAIITETGVPSMNNANGTANGSAAVGGGGVSESVPSMPAEQFSRGRKYNRRAGHSALHPGEIDAGTDHPAASGMHTRHIEGQPCGIDVSIRVEIDPSDKEGHTEGYGVHIPGLTSLK